MGHAQNLLRNEEGSLCDRFRPGWAQGVQIGCCSSPRGPPKQNDLHKKFDCGGSKIVHHKQHGDMMEP